MIQHSEINGGSEPIGYLNHPYSSLNTWLAKRWHHRRIISYSLVPSCSRVPIYMVMDDDRARGVVGEMPPSAYF